MRSHLENTNNKKYILHLLGQHTAMYAAVTESKPNISALNTKKGYVTVICYYVSNIFIWVLFLKVCHDGS